jgi:hypothetical protein
MPDPRLNVLPEEQFNYLLEHECKHAQRYEHFFSLVMIRLEKSELNAALLTGALNLIRGVIRDSDIVGAFQDKKLAMILHYADNPDPIARRVVNKIQTGLPHLETKIGRACFPADATTVEDLLRVSLNRIS